ncbi:hypothetical protein RGAI101_703 [Roseobacter sp. GAI101]|nr:hypothetical protein RGAI101_703 [Roseobacter sp. GAI101]
MGGQDRPNLSFQETLPSLHKRGSISTRADRPEARALASVAAHLRCFQILASGKIQAA